MKLVLTGIFKVGTTIYNQMYFKNMVRLNSEHTVYLKNCFFLNSSFCFFSVCEIKMRQMMDLFATFITHRSFDCSISLFFRHPSQIFWANKGPPFGAYPPQKPKIYASFIILEPRRSLYIYLQNKGFKD